MITIDIKYFCCLLSATHTNHGLKFSICVTLHAQVSLTVYKASQKNTGRTKDKEYGVSRGIDFQGTKVNYYLHEKTRN